MLLPMLDVLCFYLGSFQSICAVHDMLVVCNSLNSCFPRMVHRYFLNYFEMVLVATIITDIALLLLLLLLLFRNGSSCYHYY